MLLEEAIRQEASEIAVRESQRAEYFHEEYLSLRAQANYLKSRRNAARAAPARLADFRVKVDSDYQCPSCWIIRTTSSFLTEKTGVGGSNILICQDCEYVIIVND
jgi:superfamily II helicase